jgi:hypothetical protein
LSRLCNLSVLDLSNNYISSLGDLRQCVGLTYLNFSNNMVQDISSLQYLLKLVTLKAAHNKILTIEPLRACERLQRVIVHHNQLANFENTVETLRRLPKLVNLSMNSNPCVFKTKDARARLLAGLNLQKLDKDQIYKLSPSPAARTANFHSGLEISEPAPAMRNPEQRPVMKIIDPAPMPKIEAPLPKAEAPAPKALSVLERLRSEHKNVSDY